MRTVSMNSRLSASDARNTKSTITQTQESRGTIGRPSSSPSVIHGTMLRTRSASAVAPMAMC